MDKYADLISPSVLHGSEVVLLRDSYGNNRVLKDLKHGLEGAVITESEAALLYQK